MTDLTWAGYKLRGVGACLRWLVELDHTVLSFNRLISECQSRTFSCIRHLLGAQFSILIFPPCQCFEIEVYYLLTKLSQPIKVIWRWVSWNITLWVSNFQDKAYQQKGHFNFFLCGKRKFSALRGLGVIEVVFSKVHTIWRYQEKEWVPDGSEAFF